MPALTVQNPDLQVSSINVSDVVNPNNTVPVQWSVRNNGPGNLVNRSFKDYFYVNGERIYEANVTSVSIPVGDSIVRTAMLRIPCVSGNTLELTVSTDVENRVMEAVEANNGKTVTVGINTPDLIVSGVSPVVEQSATNVSLWSGTTAELSYNVVNNGDAPAVLSNVKDIIYFSTTPDSYQLSDTIYTNVHNLNLAIGEIATYTCAVNIPNGISGTYYYHVVCNADHALCESGAVSNNVGTSAAVEVQLSPSPDLVVSDVVAPAAAYIGTEITLTYTIQNQGTAALNNTRVAHKFYYSNNPNTYNEFNCLYTTYNNLTIEPNGSQTCSVNLTMPFGMTDGNYFIHILTDADDLVYEHNGEDNNKGHSNMMSLTTYHIDLQLVQLDGPTEMQWGQSATYTMRIRNNSSLPTLYRRWQDAIYLSTDNVLQNTDQLVQAVTHTTVVNSGAEYEVDIRVTIPYGTPSTVYLIAIADYQNINADVNISNNILIQPLTISSRPTPDLAVSEVELLDAVIAGQPTRIAYKVTNVSSEIDIVNETWNDKLFVSYNATYENVDVQLLNKDRRNISLAYNEFYRDTLTFAVPMAYNGDLYLLMMANANNNPFEIVRDNNTVAVPVNVTLPLPGDLVVTNVACEDLIISGQILHANWIIQNIGDNTLVGNGLRSLLYVSADTVFDANDRLLGRVTTDNVNLPVDATMQQSLNVRLSGLAAGEYYLIVKTDVTNAFNEVSNDNNTGHSLYPFEVTIRPLPFNENVYDTLINDEVSDYMLTVGDQRNQTVRIHVASEDSLLGAVNMIYATHNAMGNNLNYSYSTIGQYTANSELYIPSTLQGFYGVNIYGTTPTNNPQNVVVRADILPFELRAVDDDHGGNTGRVTVELTGSRFRPDMIVTMRRGNEVITADSIIYVNYYQVFAQFDLTGHTPGTYDVSAVNFCEGEAVLVNGFTVEDGQPSGLSYNLLFPNSPRPNRNVVMMLEFGNIGNIDLHDQVLEITSIGGCPIALTPEGLTLHQTVLRVPLSIDGEPQGLLRPGSYGTLNIYGYSSNALIFTIKPVVE